MIYFDQVELVQVDHSTDTITVRETLELPGTPSNLRRHGAGLTLLVDSSDLVFLEYAGAGRLRKVGTLFQRSTQVLAYTFFQPEAGGQRLLVTANSDNTLDIYSGNTNIFQVTERLECR